MKLTQLQAPMPATVPVETSLGTVTVTYDRAVLTPRYIKNDLAGPLYEKLGDLLLEWDVTDEEGKPVGPTKEMERSERILAWRVILADIPDTHLSVIYGGIWDDFLGERKPKSESPTSS